MPTHAYILLKVKTGKPKDVLNVLRGISNVEQAHACFGQPDIFALIHADDDRALAEMIMTTIQTIPGVEETDTHIVTQD